MGLAVTAHEADGSCSDGLPNDGGGVPSERDYGHTADRLDAAIKGEDRQGAPDRAAEREDSAASEVRRGRHQTSARTRPAVVAVIFIGGALGASARYGVAQLLHTQTGSFPWATFWTNVSGSLALGIVLLLVLERFPPGRYVRPFMATGFLGAYTTYSTFAVETDVLVKDGHMGTALAYVGASLVVGIAAVWVGMLVARLLPVSRRGGRQ